MKKRSVPIFGTGNFTLKGMVTNMSEENNGTPKEQDNQHNGKGRRRRSGRPGARQEEKRPSPESAQNAGGQAQPSSRQGHGGRRQRRGGRGQKESPARRLSPNVITTDADETAAASPAAPVRIEPEDRSRYRSIPDHWFDEEPIAITEDEPEEMVDIVGVRFKDSGKIYHFAPMDYVCREGMDVIVETARGIEFGTVSVPNRQTPKSSLIAPLRPVVRIATDADRERHAKNAEREEEAFRICAEKIAEHGLQMKLVEAEYTFDNSKLTFYFSADGRVDFRELVKDLASVFRTRIELRQIGIRDEAKLLGGIGICGRPFCCNTFLYDFNQVSIKMAKEQNLSLNSAKISGTCGRLMCCLRYECEAYDEEGKRTPKIDSIVKTPDGVGFVIESQTLSGIIKVKLGENDDAPVKQYHRDDVTVVGRRRGHDKPRADEGEQGQENDTL